MAHLNIKKLKRVCRLKKSVTLFTRHRGGDRYDGIILACHPSLILLQEERDFVFNGIIALPTRQLKTFRSGPLERSRDKIFSRFGLLKKLKHIPWLLKIETAQQLIQECKCRRIWPIVETQSNSKNAFYIGAITGADEKGFNLLSYDTDGKWDENYRLAYTEILRIELFDTYTKYLNQYVKEKNKAKQK